MWFIIWKRKGVGRKHVVVHFNNLKKCSQSRNWRGSESKLDNLASRPSEQPEAVTKSAEEQYQQQITDDDDDDDWEWEPSNPPSCSDESQPQTSSSQSGGNLNQITPESNQQQVMERPRRAQKPPRWMRDYVED